MSTESNTSASVRLPRSTRCGRVARNLLERELSSILTSERLEDAKTIVSELANNAFLHGVGRIDLTITRLKDRIRIAISDQGAGVSATRGHEPNNGRFGFRIVEGLSLAWGAREGRSEVWAEFAL
jgi:anti-sigma regulatory factor (Ser/Thr protein kinase)